MQKKIPNRMCIACHTMKPKKELIRIVVNEKKEVLVDFTGKAQGRGAYICKSAQCLMAARKGKKFEKVLKQSLPESTIDILTKTLEKE